MRYLSLLLLIVFLASGLHAQEEFILGKSANSLKKNAAVISAEYNVYAFESIRVQRFGIDLAYGVTDRLSLSLRGSASDLFRTGFDLENGTLTAIYRLGKENPVSNSWTFAPFFQASVIGRTNTLPTDINLDTHSSGYAVGFIVNRNLDWLTLSSSLSYAKLTFPLFVDGLLNGNAIVFQLSANKTTAFFVDNNTFQLSILGELMGQRNTDIGKYGLDLFDAGNYLDFLGGLQVTANDQYRVELAVQTEIFGNLVRLSQGLYHIRLKYLIW